METMSTKSTRHIKCQVWVPLPRRGIRKCLQEVVEPDAVDANTIVLHKVPKSAARGGNL
jgi:hypothetical protein